MMTVAEGFGMMFVGFIAIIIIGTIVFLTINKKQKHEQEEKEKKEREKIYDGF